MPVLDLRTSAYHYVRTWCASDLFGAIVPLVCVHAVDGSISHLLRMTALLRLLLWLLPFGFRWDLRSLLKQAAGLLRLLPSFVGSVSLWR